MLLLVTHEQLMFAIIYTTLYHIAWFKKQITEEEGC